MDLNQLEDVVNSAATHRTTGTVNREDFKGMMVQMGKSAAKQAGKQVSHYLMSEMKKSQKSPNEYER